MIDLTPNQLAQAATQVRRFFAASVFNEVILSPFDAYPIDYKGQTLDVKGVGQLRFNTEPEIWQGAADADRFFSISNLFRRERVLNPLRRSSFIIIDFYQPGSPDRVLKVFKSLLNWLTREGVIKRLAGLAFDIGMYDPISDGPKQTAFDSRWVVTNGYRAVDSFFEIDQRGNSTRQELFLSTAAGYLEIGAIGIVGHNKNPRYKFRDKTKKIPTLPENLSGMGIGLERLLLADELLALVSTKHYENR